MQQKVKIVIRITKVIKYKKNHQVLSNKINKISELKIRIKIRMKIKIKIKVKITMIL